ncbi:N-terminal nucleophile aminohydrolase [Hymenopellis radicata]|nr:N-terminal nucleophile aminohydrolase [Hymenopellis radicata]
MYYLVVHGGAGNLSKSSEPAVKHALRRACKTTIENITANSSALDLVEQAITILEDDPCLNAGFGSNLTLEGTVECDASIIDGKAQSFGGVGAVHGIKNPIALARKVLEHSQSVDPLGRVPPLMLVAHGARQFGESRLDPSCFVDPEALVHPKAFENWTRWKDVLRNPSTEITYDKMQDTVGAITFRREPNEIAAGVSSGGLLLKHPGRIGEAAAYGAGCWAEQADVACEDNSRLFSVACSVSGCGEYIMRASMAQSIGSAVLAALITEDDVHEVLQRAMLRFWNDTKKRCDDQPNAGVVLITTSKDDDEWTVRLWCAFTTPSMTVAYISSNSQAKVGPS